MTLEILEVDDLLLTRRRHIASGNGQSTFEGKSWLERPTTRRTATGTSLAPLPFSAQPTTATIGTFTLMSFQAPQVRPQVVCAGTQCTRTQDTWLSSQLPNTFNLQERLWMFTVWTGPQDF